MKLALPKLTKKELNQIRNIEILYHANLSILSRLNIIEQGVSNETKKDSGNWNYIPMKGYSFINNLYRISKYISNNNLGNKALDIGCGAGNILSLFKTFDLKPHGIEYNPKFKAKYDYENIIIGDALDIKPEHYKDYNLIYLYRPINDTKRLKQLLTNIINGMPSNSILYCIYITYPEGQHILSMGMKRMKIKKDFLNEIYIKP